MVLYTPNLNLPKIEPTDTPISYPTTQNDLATKLDRPGIFAELTLPGNIANQGGGVWILLATMAGSTSGITVAGGICTVPTAGRYLILATVGRGVGTYWTSMSPGSDVARYDEFIYSGMQHNNPSSGCTLTGSKVYNLAANAKVALWTFCSASNIVVNAGSWLQIRYVGP